MIPSILQAAGRSIRISIENSDALTYRSDVLALKYAQELFGVDKAAVEAMRQSSSDPVSLLPSVGKSLLLPTAGQLEPLQVLFVGVPPLYQFRYLEMRQFSQTVLTVLARKAPLTRSLALTVHGPNYGLDEIECFRAILAGLLDQLASGDFPAQLEHIAIVELKKRRADRFVNELNQLLRTRELIVDPQGAAKLELGANAAERMRVAGYSSESKPLIFVAMPFREDMADYYHYGILGATQKAGFLCERADQSHFTGDILDWVKRRIDAGTILLADLTFSNPNVYLEVGYAWGRGKRTLLLVRDSGELQFDVRGQRSIVYRRIKDLEELLSVELEALKASRP